MKFRLLEGTDYVQKAIDLLVQSGLYEEKICNNIVQLLYRGPNGNDPDIHAFVHAPNWLLKYLKGIIRMMVQYANTDTERATRFLYGSVSFFDRVLTWIKENRTPENATKLDHQFVDEWSYEDCQKFFKQITDARDTESDRQLQNFKPTATSYKLIPIESYEQFHKEFGGRATGDGTSEKGAGTGGTAWCHANGEGTYKSWIDGDKMFYILAKNDWKKISATPGGNCPKDEYGLSLMAILVDEDAKLQKCTLRWNHVNVPTNADNQFTTYAELSNIVGFNVKEAIIDDMRKRGIDAQKGIEIINAQVYNIIKNAGNSIFDDTIPREIRTKFTKLNIPKNITKIETNAFSHCTKLETVNIPNSVEGIGDLVFYRCPKLKTINIPKSVTTMGSLIFSNCESLTEVIIPEGMTTLKAGVCYWCTKLTTITIPVSVKTFASSILYKCADLKDINYQGTKDQWEAIPKGQAWDYLTGNYIVHCVDGDIEKHPTINEAFEGIKIHRSKYGVGKDMLGKIYLHKQYAYDVIPKDIFDKAVTLLPDDFNYNCLMYNPKEPYIVRFDEAANFDTAREPFPGNMIAVNVATGTIRKGFTNQIWHHKWLWVKDDYTGFDVQKAHDWSQEWSKYIRKPSGYKDKWNAALIDNNLPLDEDVQEDKELPNTFLLHLDFWTGGGYEFNNVFTEEDKNIISQNSKIISQPLYRLEIMDNNSYTKGLTINLNTPKSFTKSNTAHQRMINEYMEYENPYNLCLFKTVGKVKAFDINNFYYNQYFSWQEECFVSGSFVVVDIIDTPIRDSDKTYQIKTYILRETK